MTGGAAAAAALAGVCCLASCAVPGTPRPTLDELDRLACRVDRGSDDGLILTVDLTADIPPDAELLLGRDGELVGRVAVANLGELPRTQPLGDAGVVAGQRHDYVCALVIDETSLAEVRFQVLGAAPPAVPRTPHTQSAQTGVLLRWEAEDDVWVQVWRRDVLGGAEAQPVSPSLSTDSWLDATAEDGHVYAYSLQASRWVEDVPWHSRVGPEQYIEVERGTADR